MARHVLLADDSTTLHRVVRDVLEGHGIRVTCTENGEEALRFILESPPDLVLADLNMPRMGGLELCELLRREPHFRHIPVVFLVGPFDEYDDDAARRVGGNDHLIKPFDSFRLLAVVNRFLPAEEAIAVVEADNDFEPAEELCVSATVEPIDDDALLRGGVAVAADLADLPEPETLVRAATESSSSSGEWVSLELSAAEQYLTEDSEELPESAELVIAGDPGDLPEAVEESGGIQEAEVRNHLAERLGAMDIEQSVLEVIREEVGRILPGIVESVVRERIREIECEIEQREKVTARARSDSG